MVAEVVTDPLLLRAVKVYVVVTPGVIALLPEAETSPIPLSILTVVASEVDQVKVLDCPAVIIAGETLRVAVGNGVGGGVGAGVGVAAGVGCVVGVGVGVGAGGCGHRPLFFLLSLVQPMPI